MKNVWIVLGWEEGYGNWEVLSVLFDAAAVDVKVREIFDEYTHYRHVKVECWHRDDVDSPNASFYEVEDFYNDEEVPTMFPEEV